MSKRKNNQRGAVTVEATIALTAFLFMFMMLYSIIIVCRAQAIMGSALNNTAKEISQYTYLYSITGIHEELDKATSTDKTDYIDSFAEDFNTSFNAIQGLNDNADTLVQTEITDMGGLLTDWNTINIDMNENIDDLKDGAQGLSDSIEELAKDPKGLLIGLCKIAAGDGISLIKSKILTPPICRALITKHLSSYEDEDTELFLKNLNIVPSKSGGKVSYLRGIDFSNSSLFCSKDYDIVIRAQYQVKITPYLPLDIKINLCQSAATRGWADGDGRHVDENGQVIINEPDFEEETESTEPVNEIRNKMVSEYGEYIVAAVEEEKADADPPTSQWAEDDWRYYIKLYISDCENQFCKNTLAGYSNGESVQNALKTTLDKLISENPDKKSELEKFYTQENLLELINRYASEYNSGDFSAVKSDYTSIEQELLESSHQLTRPSDNTIMQKVISENCFNSYYNKDSEVMIKGCVTRVQDAISYTTSYAQARENLRLDYQNTEFSEAGTVCYIVRYENVAGSTYEKTSGNKPCTCNGYIATKKYIVSEWCSNKQIYPKKGAVYKIGTSGNEECVGVIVSGKFYKY